MLVGGFLWMGSLRPEQSLMWLVGAAVFTSFSSATQDILIDSYRRELLQDNQLGMGSSVYVLGYRFGMLTAGSLAPLLSDRISWGAVYYTMAGLMGVGLMTTIFSPEPTISGASPKTLKEAVIEPFLEYFRRPKALIILWFILLYKIGDAMASALLKPFYSEIGYSNTQIGAVVGPVGIWAMILGGLFGGVLLVKLSIQRALLGFGFLQALSTLAFGGLALWKFSEPSLLLLGAVIFFENFTSGMGTAAYAAFMASLTNKRFTATQYALLTSLMGVPMHIFGAYTGVLQTQLGWAGFFVFCTVIAIPGLVLLALFKKWGPVSSQA
jgi:PAT family beta-lactamase induction signal transducer AmpG